MKKKEFFTEYVPINEIQQFFMHYPAASRTVVIFLHGGPGQTELFFTYLTRPQIPSCSFVFYDQRGTGKTQIRNRTHPDDITLDILIDDLHETVAYIREKYAGQQIILLGHSWGSVLGIEYVKRYPVYVSAYVGMGQVIDMLKSERIAFEELKSLVVSKGKTRSIQHIKSFEGYPDNLDKDHYTETTLRFRRLQAKYGYSIGLVDMLTKIIKSPLFSLRDAQPFLTTFKTNKNLMDMLMAYSTINDMEFHLPIFFICGQNDWQAPGVLVKQYYDSLRAPYKEIYWIENAGHLTDIDNPAEYNKTIAAIRATIEGR